MADHEPGRTTANGARPRGQARVPADGPVSGSRGSRRRAESLEVDLPNMPMSGRCRRRLDDSTTRRPSTTRALSGGQAMAWRRPANGSEGAKRMWLAAVTTLPAAVRRGRWPLPRPLCEADDPDEVVGMRVVLSIVMVLLLFAGCGTSEPELSESVVGVWETPNGFFVEFREDGTYDVGAPVGSGGSEWGTWSTEGAVLTQVADERYAPGGPCRTPVTRGPSRCPRPAGGRVRPGARRAPAGPRPRPRPRRSCRRRSGKRPRGWW